MNKYIRLGQRSCDACQNQYYQEGTADEDCTDVGCIASILLEGDEDGAEFGDCAQGRCESDGSKTCLHHKTQSTHTLINPVDSVKRNWEGIFGIAVVVAIVGFMAYGLVFLD